MAPDTPAGPTGPARGPGEGSAGRVAAQAAEITLDPAAVTALREELGTVARQTVAAIMEEVPAYDAPFQGRMGRVIERAVQVSLESFVELAAEGGPPGRARPVGVGVTAARELGQVEARQGRPVDALLAAYRVGARVSWRELSRSAVAAGVDAATLGRFAELVFTYIDELSAASVAGHSAESASAERERQVHVHRLTRGLLGAEPEATLRREAEEARWTPPRTLTAVLVPRDRLPTTLGLLDPRTLTLTEDLPDADGAPPPATYAVALVPETGGPARPRLLQLLEGRDAIAGPARPWHRVVESYARAVRALPHGQVDADAVLPQVLLAADPAARADLRQAALAPFADLPEATADRLAETLRAWLLLQGRRELVAEELHVHPQTVRYRMGQVRELVGDRLSDPDEVLAMILALA